MSDFDRDVYCIAGLPFDALDMNEAVSTVRHAKYINRKCFMSTPNMNFITNAVSDPEFLKSVIYSDLVVADGTPIIWMAKMLGIPIKQRIAGSNLFETLSTDDRRHMKVYFMGGVDGVAKAASDELNRNANGLSCVGYYSPGFGSVDDMSTDEIIDNINASKADFLVVALGAKKGQAWILKNIDRITIPLVSHLGAVINFEAKRFKRAPTFMQNTGLEWLWRIKEEPALWRRYFGDGMFFLKLLMTKIIPLSFWLKLNGKRLASIAKTSEVVSADRTDHTEISVKGAVLDVSDDLRRMFREASNAKKDVSINLSEAKYVSFAFFGLVLMLKKQLDHEGYRTNLIGCNSEIGKIVDWNGLGYLKA